VITQCLLASISGRVQGVGFRYYTQREARSLGIRGWVENRPDGSVAACICGSPEQIKLMQAWLRHGPDGATVDQVSFSDTHLPEAHQDFLIR